MGVVQFILSKIRRSVWTGYNKGMDRKLPVNKQVPVLEFSLLEDKISEASPFKVAGVSSTVKEACLTLCIIFYIRTSI
jgi:hypothetical protein